MKDLFDITTDKYIALLIKYYKISLDEIKSEIASMYERYGDQIKFSDMARFNRLVRLEKEIADVLQYLTGEINKTTAEAIQEIYESNYMKAVDSLESQTGVRLLFGKINPGLITASLENPLDRIGWRNRIKDQTKRYLNIIKQEITVGLIQGKGYSKVARAISEKTDIALNSSMRIVRTESHRAYSKAHIDTLALAERKGLKVDKVWVATQDKRTRDTHFLMHGQVADKNGLFYSSSGASTEAPGMFGIPEEDINCRCRIKLLLK